MDFPWYIWAVGWVALLKATVWFFFEPIQPSGVLFWKCLLFSIPYLICASGVWNVRRWAAAGVGVLAVLDMLVLISGVVEGEHLFTSREFLSRPLEQGGMALFYVAVFFAGRLGGLFVIAASPYVYKYSRSWEAGVGREMAQSMEHDGLRYMMGAVYLIIGFVMVYSLFSAFF